MCIREISEAKWFKRYERKTHTISPNGRMDVIVVGTAASTINNSLTLICLDFFVCMHLPLSVSHE